MEMLSKVYQSHFGKYFQWSTHFNVRNSIHIDVMIHFLKIMKVYLAFVRVIKIDSLISLIRLADFIQINQTPGTVPSQIILTGQI